jgi:hypothetical protein
MKFRCSLALLCLVASAAAAQEAPIVRATIDPPRVTVGQKATLRIDLLAPNYMTKPPVLPDFQLRNAVTRAESPVNMTEQHGGTTFAGVRFEFSLYPQEPGSYAIPAQSITVSYAAEPPASRDAAVALAPLTFEAFIPDAAQALDPFVAAERLTVRQQVRRSSEALKIGDAVTRTVTLEATGIPAMLLPPTQLAPVEGTQVYPAEPELRDTSDRRTGVLSATRVDQATYMLQRAGTVTLPAIGIGWWNTHDRKVERARLEPVVLSVAAAPAAAAPSARPQATTWRRIVLFVLDHWLALVTALAAAAALAWLAPRVVRTLHRRWVQRRDRYRASEAYAFAALRRAARRGDAAKTYAALLDWVARFDPAASDRTAASLVRAADDPALAREIAALERMLFAPQGAAAWSPRSFARRIGVARRRLRRVAHRTDRVLPHTLNPSAAEVITRRRWRAVAR